MKTAGNIYKLDIVHEWCLRSILRIRKLRVSWHGPKQIEGTCHPCFLVGTKEIKSLEVGNIPGGMKRVACTPFSLTSILWTPGAMYHLSTRAEARGARFLKSSIWWPLYTEKLTSRGLQTLRFLNLEGKRKWHNCIYFHFLYTWQRLTLGRHDCLEQVSYSTPSPWLLSPCTFPQNWNHL